MDRQILELFTFQSAWTWYGSSIRLGLPLMLQQFSAFLKAWQNSWALAWLSRSSSAKRDAVPLRRLKPTSGSKRKICEGWDLWEGLGTWERCSSIAKCVRLRQQLCSKDKTIVIPEVPLYSFLCCIAVSHSRRSHIAVFPGLWRLGLSGRARHDLWGHWNKFVKEQCFMPLTSFYACQ